MDNRPSKKKLLLYRFISGNFSQNLSQCSAIIIIMNYRGGIIVTISNFFAYLCALFLLLHPNTLIMCLYDYSYMNTCHTKSGQAIIGVHNSSFKVSSAHTSMSLFVAIYLQLVSDNNVGLWGY